MYGHEPIFVVSLSTHEGHSGYAWFTDKEEAEKHARELETGDHDTVGTTVNNVSLTEVDVEHLVKFWFFINQQPEFVEASL